MNQQELNLIKQAAFERGFEKQAWGLLRKALQKFFKPKLLEPVTPPATSIPKVISGPGNTSKVVVPTRVKDQAGKVIQGNTPRPPMRGGDPRFRQGGSNLPGPF